MKPKSNPGDGNDWDIGQGKETLFSTGKPARKENIPSTTTPPQSNDDSISAKIQQAACDGQDDDAAGSFQLMKDALETGKFQFFKKNYSEALKLFHTATKYLKDMPRSPLYAINIRSWIMQTHICLEDYNIPQEYIWETFVIRSTVASADLVVLAKMLAEIQVQCAMILAHKGNLFLAILFAEIAKELDTCFEKPIILISRIQEFIKSRVIDGHFPGMDLESGEVNVEAMECAICSKSLPFLNKHTPVKT